MGQNLVSLDQYLSAERPGRKRRLGQAQRVHVWDFFEKYCLLLKEDRVEKFGQRLVKAVKSAQPVYDFVFIDEAQDLKPIGLVLCIKLCRHTSRVFLTADTNQSIYGNGLSWSDVAEDLRLQGRARILKRNYRTTMEIWDATMPLLPQSADADKETLDSEAVKNGDFPVLLRYDKIENISNWLNDFIKTALLKEKTSLESAVVLCRDEQTMRRIKNIVDPKLCPKIMRSKDLDMSHKGVKIMTMHAAKGLQFPVVVVVDSSSNNSIKNEHIEKKLIEQRLFYVACSRAMQHLAVVTKPNYSGCLSNIDEDSWNIKEL